jgi:hypothetical protein
MPIDRVQIFGIDTGGRNPVPGDIWEPFPENGVEVLPFGTMTRQRYFFRFEPSGSTPASATTRMLVNAPRAAPRVVKRDGIINGMNHRIGVSINGVPFAVGTPINTNTLASGDTVRVWVAARGARPASANWVWTKP